jgi:hypothetical protein
MPNCHNVAIHMQCSRTGTASTAHYDLYDTTAQVYFNKKIINSSLQSFKFGTLKYRMLVTIKTTNSQAITQQHSD